MSVYVQCSDAVTALLEHPEIRIITYGPEGVFTELDVVHLAARRATANMTAEERQHWMIEAARQTSNRMGALFRQDRVIRYGPVSIPAGGIDYVRHAAKIIYGAPVGPTMLVTPNGRFPQLRYGDDPIRRAGRRHGTARDDFTPWERQDLSPQKSDGAHAEVIDLQRQIGKLEAENRRLRGLIPRVRR